MAAQLDEIKLRTRLQQNPGSWMDLYELANLLHEGNRHDEAVFVLRRLLNTCVPHEIFRARTLVLFSRTLDQLIGLDEDWREHDDLDAWRARLATQRLSGERESYVVLLQEATEAIRLASVLWPVSEPFEKAVLCAFYAEHLRLLGLPTEAEAAERIAADLSERACA